MADVSSVRAGGYFNCALTNRSGPGTGEVWCWGNDAQGQLGKGGGAPTEYSESSRPVRVCLTGDWDDDSASCVGGQPLRGVTSLAMGANHACAVMDDATLRCWGNNTSGELGTNTNDAYAVRPQLTCAQGSFDGATCTGAALAGVRAAAAGRSFTCALLTDGHVRCWGYGWNGRLGNGTTSDQRLPVAVAQLSGVQMITAGDSHACASPTMASTAGDLARGVVSARGVCRPVPMRRCRAPRAPAATASLARGSRPRRSAPDRRAPARF